MSNTSTTDPQGQTPNGEAPNGQTPTPESQTANGQQQTPLENLPADIQDYIKRLRSEAEKANDKEKAEAKARKKAEEARLAEQGEYKKLAEQHQARLTELEPVAERYTALSAQVAAQIEAQIKDWPNEVKTFDPGAGASVEQRLAWLEKSKPLIAKLAGQQRVVSAGNGPNPKPSSGTPETRQQEMVQKLRSTGGYGNIK